MTDYYRKANRMVGSEAVAHVVHKLQLAIKQGTTLDDLTVERIAIEALGETFQKIDLTYFDAVLRSERSKM